MVSPCGMVAGSRSGQCGTPTRWLSLMSMTVGDSGGSTVAGAGGGVGVGVGVGTGRGAGGGAGGGVVTGSGLGEGTGSGEMIPVDGGAMEKSPFSPVETLPRTQPVRVTALIKKE